MIRRPPRSTLSSSSAASDVYKRQMWVVAFASNGALSPPRQGVDERIEAFEGGWFSHLPDRRDAFGKAEFRGDAELVVAVFDLANFFARFGLAGSSTGWTGALVRVRRTMRNLGRQTSPEIR